jgi:hypothetical protein
LASGGERGVESRRPRRCAAAATYIASQNAGLVERYLESKLNFIARLRIREIAEELVATHFQRERS